MVRRLRWDVMARMLRLTRAPSSRIAPLRSIGLIKQSLIN
jgi:hypothetical protein